MARISFWVSFMGMISGCFGGVDGERGSGVRRKLVPLVFFPPLRVLVGLDGEFVRFFCGFWGSGAVDCLVGNILGSDWSDGGCLAVRWFLLGDWVWIFRGRLLDRALGSPGPFWPGFGWGMVQKRSFDFFKN